MQLDSLLFWEAIEKLTDPLVRPSPSVDTASPPAAALVIATANVLTLYPQEEDQGETWAPSARRAALAKQIREVGVDILNLSFSVCKSLSCLINHSARALVHSLNGELLASRRKNLCRCSLVHGCGCGCGCGSCCVVLRCVLWCVVLWCCCVVCGYPSKRFLVTPAVCPRLFAFLTTLTVRALHKNHIVSTAFETIAKTETKKNSPRAVSNVS